MQAQNLVFASNISDLAPSCGRDNFATEALGQEMGLRGVLGFVLLFPLAMSVSCLAQSSTDDSDRAEPVRITSGPVVEEVTDSTATIAWSTNVNAGTTLHYGSTPDQLNWTASMPWGGLTHRVYLKGLRPATGYCFQAESGAGQGTGTTAVAPVECLHTKNAGERSGEN